MDDDQIRSGGPQPERQRRTDCHGANLRDHQQPDHVHQAVPLFDGCAFVIGHQHRVLDLRSRAIAHQLQDGFHAATSRRIELSQMKHPHDAHTA